jgi:hypothetical protein
LACVIMIIIAMKQFCCQTCRVVVVIVRCWWCQDPQCQAE